MKACPATLINKSFKNISSCYFENLIDPETATAMGITCDINSAYIFPSMNQARIWARKRRIRFGANDEAGKWKVVKL